MKIAMISDVHDKWQDLVVPECDLLISAGDYSFVGEQSILRDFHLWMSRQPAKHKISVQGNHEVWVQRHWALAKQMAEEKCPGVHFIDEGGVEIEGRKIWCSAVTPWFHGWAWNKQRGEEIRKHWDGIPDDTEVLVTHGPPFGVLDQVQWKHGNSEHLGCEDLLDRVLRLQKLKLHVFGRIHSGSGELDSGGTRKIHFVNASIVDESYKPAYPVRIWDMP